MRSRSLAPRRRIALLIIVASVAPILLAGVRAGDALVVRSAVDAPDAIISLASHEWERLPEAARQAQAHPQAAVWLTVPQSVTPYNCHDCANRPTRLRALGVDDRRVILLALTDTGTYGEAVAAREFARSAGTRQLLVVTSPYHTRRALAVFRKVFEGSGVVVGVEPATADSVARPGRWWLGGYDRSYVVYEGAALVYYTWTYGIRPLDPGPGLPSQRH